MDIPNSSSSSSSPTEPEHPISDEQLTQSDNWVIVLPENGDVITSLATRNSYTMGAKIGEGAFGIVYECSDGWRNDLAAKVMKQRGMYEQASKRPRLNLESCCICVIPTLRTFLTPSNTAKRSTSSLSVAGAR
jgi:hypothetical protein